MQKLEVYEDERSFAVEGISGKISKFLKEGVSYPFFLLENTKEHPVQLNRLQVLANLFNASQNSNSSLTPVSVYYKDCEKVLKLGKLGSRQVKAFLRLFSDNSIVGMFDKDTELRGEYLYVLSE